MTLSEGQQARARFIRTVLAWHGHNQGDLGRIIGRTQANAWQKINGKRRFTDDELVLIAEAYGLDPGYLLRPPELEGVLGSVRSAAGTLLTCTYRQLCWSEPLSARLVQNGSACSPLNLAA